MILVNLRAFSPANSSKLLYIFTKKRQGSEALVSQLVLKVENDSEIAGQLDLDTLM